MIVNEINNHKYIGQSKNIWSRFSQHHLSEYKKGDTQLYQAMNKYGIENFSVVILELCEENLLNEREIYWIAYYDTFKNGYNGTLGGNSTPYEQLYSEETKNKRKNTLNINKSLQSQNHPRAKLSNEEVIFIRKRYIAGESVQDIYQDYKNLYSIDTLKNIIFGRSYKTVGYIPKKEEKRYSNKNKKLGKMPDDTVREIRNLYKSGEYSYSQLSKKYTVSIPTIAGIIKRKYYKSVH